MKGEDLMHKTQFYLGEERHIRLLVHSKEDLPFTIQKSSYELQKLGKVESAGECKIEDHELDVKIAPQEKGIYRLLVTYEVADEKLMDCVEVTVL